MSHAARRLRPISRWISTVRPLCLPLRRLAVDPLGRRAREHRVLGRHPPLAAAPHPARHVVVDAGRAQHAGAPERDEARAVGHLGEVALERDRAELVGSASVGAGHQTGRRRPGLGVVELGAEQAGAELAERGDVAARQEAVAADASAPSGRSRPSRPSTVRAAKAVSSAELTRVTP